jgi:hypothetical protein
MRQGVERVTQSPTEAAASKKEKFRAGIQEAIDSGKWERGLRRVSLDEWKSKMIDKGLGRVAAGIDAAAPKVREFAAELLPYQDRLKGQIEGMPDISLEDNINRMTTWIREMSKFSRSR